MDCRIVLEDNNRRETTHLNTFVEPDVTNKNLFSIFENSCTSNH